MVQLHFDACIFAGIICRECGVALDSKEMRAFKLKRHLEEQHDNMELDHQHEFKRLSALMEKCASSLFGFATDAQKAQFCEMFLTCEGAEVVWCAHQSYCSFPRSFSVHTEIVPGLLPTLPAGALF